MDIYLVRIREQPGGSLYIDRKAHATTNDNYIAISHVWGTKETVQKYTVNGVPWEVSLSPGKKDILSILRRDDICGDGWFWMDLFCLDQSESPSISIADQLMAIPSIYKCSRCVKILIESPVCMKWQETASQAFEQGPINEEAFQEEELAHGRSCPYLLFADPWFDRLWTRQEGLYACVLDLIILKPVSCRRHSRDPTSAWIAHGTLLAHRFRAETFLLDKLAYHGLQPLKAKESLFSLYFDVIYKRHVNITLAYDCESGPDPKYNPIVEAWRSQRCTAKARDYVLAVFPDVDGYNVPVGAKKMSFPELLLDAIHQPAVCRQFKFAPKVPRGMVSPSGKGTESILPWLIDTPSNIGEAYDTFTANNTTSGTDSRPGGIHGNIELEDITFTKSGLCALKEDWKRTTDIYRHVVLASPSGPCTGSPRQDVSDDGGLLQQYFAQEFMHIAVSQYLPQEKMNALELQTNGVLPFDRIRDIPEEVYARELKRFLVCLICGASLFTADKVLETADVVRVSTLYGPLLGVMHRETKRVAKQDQLMLACSPTWDLQGFYIGLRVGDGMSVRGRTIIPNSSVWDSIENLAKTLES
ncbi:uncharacterized protein F4807DRAFT_444592 [Annulohypoxylon truncatum]|uniref:uncharacterized protein n=1 Tax=Annulohypoxylon truncatum TaxID=327061 RepID=UPI002008E4BD|nr:uncharacterized protein F4807DRAFT_444592 [Annulohypoxylon truncatum]KAI1204979.1 hypothetical protein F4807DRAFT_444592 [Annulohypoxylon truncatum]